jgi:eukaryotic-like serine/threonine-protein kinase
MNDKATPAASVDTDRLRRINALLQTALALPPERRADWLQQLSAEHAPLKGGLSVLLARGAVETDTFLSAPLALSEAGLLGPGPELDQAGNEVGPWRLISPLGQGGMAAVWLAERSDGQLHRQVALKLPHCGGVPGLAQRMQRERDILAALAHPNIARLYDAGTTAQGRPWLAMEHVQGLSIDRHCQQPQHSVTEVLRLFLQVTAAVADAHAHLVVHRDLKPNNILVTDAGEVRLLDFGVAKLLKQDSPEAGELTQLLGRALTPDYASPEQVSGRPVTVATDIYSLGVVLYELLTGQRPYRLQRSTMAALEEAIMAANVPLASRSVTDQPHLARTLRGDLDNILAKALRKHSAQRYSSVEAFGADIQRYLDGQPVLAQPRSRGYLMAKFLRRNRVGVGAALAVALSFCLGLGLALWQTLAAQQQAELARSRLIDAEAAVEFASALISDGIRPGERLSQEELLQRAGEMALSTPLTRPRDRLIAIDVITAWLMTFGRDADAKKLMDTGLAGLSASELTPTFICKQGALKAELGQLDEGLRLLALGLQSSAQDPEAAFACLARRARVLRNSNDAAGALRDSQAALNSFEHTGYKSPVGRGRLLGDLGYALVLNGRTAEADQRYAQALQLFASAGLADNPIATSLRNNWGVALISAGNPLAAREQFERAWASTTQGQATGAVPMYLQFNLGNALRLLALHDSAETRFRNLAEEAARRGAKLNWLGALNGLAGNSLARGQHEAARARLDEGAALLKEGEIGPDTPPALGHGILQGEWLLAQNRNTEAREQFTRSLDRYAHLKLNIGTVSAVLVSRSRALAAEGQAALALADAQRSLEVGMTLQGGYSNSNLTGRAWLQLARLHAAAGRRSQASQAIDHALAHLQATLGAEHPVVHEARQLRATLN